MKATIYTLTDPSTGLVYYVGQTCKKLSQRLYGHISCKRYKTNIKLRELGIVPLIEKIEVVDEYPDDAELYWIHQFKEWGFPIENRRTNGIYGRSYHNSWKFLTNDDWKRFRRIFGLR